MPRFSANRRVRHAATQMFELVADVERYPQFVPLCQATKVRRRVESGDGIVSLIADMTVAYKIVRETFTTRVMLDRGASQILVEYLDGPFSFLENKWHFKPLAETSCDVEFFIAYEFRSQTLGLLMGAMFETAFRRFAEAFERRADLIYAEPTS